MKKEFTATVYILWEKKVLLHFHHKLQKWLPPGGHVEENETPPEAARREVLEETGIEIEFLIQENVWLNEPNASSFIRPYLCLLEEIPQYKDTPAHQHMDFIYLARPISDRIEMTCSSPPIRWFGLEELEPLKPHVDIFNDTLNIIKHLLTKDRISTIEQNADINLLHGCPSYNFL